MSKVVHALCSEAFADSCLRPEKSFEIVVLKELEAALMLPPGTPLVVEDELLTRGDPQRAALAERGDLVLVGDFDLPKTIEALAGAPKLAHVVWRSKGLLRRQLRSTLTQLAGGPLWTLDKYIEEPTVIDSVTVRSSDQKSDCIDRVARLAAQLGGFSELAAGAAMVASELVMNAIFNAPVEPATGQPKYRGQPRDAHLSLAPGEEVSLSYGANEHVFGLAVTDQFGRFNRETLLSNLVRSSRPDHAQIRMRTPGAGVGLFMILNAVSQLDVQVARGGMTRVVALFGLCKRYRDFEAFGHSLNFFGREGA
jgi:hypothetical protein